MACQVRPPSAAIDLLFPSPAHRLLTENRLSAATRLLSLSGEGALAWHQVCPWADYMKLDNIQLRLAVRWELGLPLPQLQVALRRGLGCGCCGAAVFDVLGDHVLEGSCQTVW